MYSLSYKLNMNKKFTTVWPRNEGILIYLEDGGSHGFKFFAQKKLGRIGFGFDWSHICIGWMSQRDACLHHVFAKVTCGSDYEYLALFTSHHIPDDYS